MTRHLYSIALALMISSLAIAPIAAQVQGKILNGAVGLVFTHCEFEEDGRCGSFDSLECGWPSAGGNICVSSVWGHPCRLGQSIFCDFREKYCVGRCNNTGVICYSATRTYCN